MKPNLHFRNSLLCIFLSLLFCASINAQVGIGTITPNSDALLDVNSTVLTPGGLLLPRMNLTGTNNPAPLSAHVTGMTVYNTATTGNVTPGIYINNGTRWLRIEDQSPVASITTLTGDVEISSLSPTYASVPGIADLSFTARRTSVMVLLTASGFGYTNSMAYVQLRVRNITTATTVGGTNTKIQSYDDITGTVTPWSASFSKLLTGLTIGTTYTLRVQGAVNGILGVPNAAIFSTSNPDTHHMSLSVIQ